MQTDAATGVATTGVEAQAINVMRALAMDAVQRANCGHPGTPMALAPLAHVLASRIMRFDPAAPEWPNRDRFVLSAGHASMLLYSMLHLTGYDLTLDDLRDFRQWGSRTPGHPERGHTAGVEVTTGPLGQGFANGVGMAIVERHFRERFGSDVCDHRVFAICSDGDIQEGITHEAAALAGHLRLGRLVYVYDDNRITIDGGTELAMSEHVPDRFRAYGWHVVELGDCAEDLDAIETGMRTAMAVDDRPSLVVLRSHIGFPSPKFTDTSAAHGLPLGGEEIRVVKTLMDFDPDADFVVPTDVADWYRTVGGRGHDERTRWESAVADWRVAEPNAASEYDACITGKGLLGWDAKLPTFLAGDSIATRNANANVLSAIGDVVPGLLGGSADLTGNTGVKMGGVGIFDADQPGGRLIHFGVREHAMAAIANGMGVSGALPFVGTFFVFSDYMRPAIRLAALQRIKVAFVFSHDSIAVGEDGPTHQPIEHLAALRAIPGLRVLRPADANEVAHAWKLHIDGDGPTAIVLSRQNLPVLDATASRAIDGVARGAYVLTDEPNATPDVVLVATGSEVAMALDASEILGADGVSARVVSFPSWDAFAQQPPDYRASVFPPGVPRLGVEAGTSFGWAAWVDATVSIDHFGASAPAATNLERFGFSPENIADKARALIRSPEGPSISG